MKGKILDFSIQTNTGIITGDDQNRYNFIGSEWKEAQSPVRGNEVDFEVNAEGQAIAVYKVNSQSSSIGTQLTDLVSPPKGKSEEQYNPLDWYQKCIKNCINFKGRARRKEFWFFQLVSFIIMMLFLFIFGMEGFATTLVTLVLFFASMAVSIRRLHDVNLSGWWYLLSFTGIGLILLIIWWLKEGDANSNLYGESPK